MPRIFMGADVVTTAILPRPIRSGHVTNRSILHSSPCFALAEVSDAVRCEIIPARWPDRTDGGASPINMTIHHDSTSVFVSQDFAIPRYIRLVVFDLDGTLIAHNFRYWCREAVRIFPLLGADPVTFAGVVRDFGSGDLFAALPSCDRESLILRFWDLYNEQGTPAFRCLPRTRATLLRLKASGLRIAIASARMQPSSLVKAKLQHRKIDNYVDFVVTGAESAGERCSTKVPMLRRLLDVAGVSPNEALMVGDAPSDIEWARSAGYPIQVAVCTGGIYPEVLAAARPTAVIKAVSSLYRAAADH
jgi:AHBA synthesis associated protein